MTKQNTDHAQIMVPPPLVFLGYLIGALILNWDRAIPRSMDIICASWVDLQLSVNIIRRFSFLANAESEHSS